MIKVLAVDDEEPIRNWLNYCISKFEDFSCVTAASAGEGLELFRLERPDIVLSDIEMPGMSGLEMLRQLQQSEPDLCSIVLTSHDDFEYARTALKLNTAEYMLKTEMNEENLLALLGKTAVTLQKKREAAPPALMQREHFLQAVALGKNTEPLTAALMAQYHIPLGKGPVLAIDCWNSGRDKTLEEAAAALPAMGKGMAFTLVADHILFLVNVRTSAASGSKEIVEAWEGLLAPRSCASCGISDVQDSVAQLPKAIAQAQRRCALQYYLPECSVFFSDPVPPETLQDEEMFHVEYMRALLDQDFQTAHGRLVAFAEVVRKTRPSDVTAVKRTFLTSTISFLYFADNAEEDAPAQENRIKTELMESRSFEGLLEAVENVFRPFLQRTATWGLTAPIRQAIAYMEQHYAEKITLGEVAGQVSFSPEHFSRLFTKETGVNFVTYANNLRMKNAVKLLETTNDKVYEIAEKVGFFSLSYFSTSFKKKFGLNPYEYQISYQKRAGHIK